MRIAAGTKLGPYEIASLVGAGGMGEVYKARDTRLNRTVAIKVLPQDLSTRPDAKARFEREAQTIAALNHPHICTLHDVGEHAGTSYLVMELVEGETLAERLKRGAMPADQILRYAIEMTDALDKAHRKGVVHRDLKPANIMLTKAGVKLLDFGLAKLKERENKPAADFSNAPTQDKITAHGVISGTLQYISPEQVNGHEADARSDIFALGAVLYEMTTGRLAFDGASPASVMAAVLNSEPTPVRQLQPSTPAALERVIRTCLAKDADERFQSAHDIKLQLESFEELRGANADAVVGQPKARRGILIALAVMTVVAVGLLAALLRQTFQPHDDDSARLLNASLTPPPDTSFASLPGVALSPDGRHLAFTAISADRKQKLWVQRLDRGKAQALDGTEGAREPFWSPDGKFLGFFADGKLKKVSSNGAGVQALSEAPSSRSGTWGADDVILFAPGATAELYKVSANGGPRTKVTQFNPNKSVNAHRHPYFLPNGHDFVYRCEPEGICVASLEKPDGKLLLPSDSNAIYAAGHLLFIRQSTLMAQRFDTGKLQIEGDAFVVAEHVGMNAFSRRGIFTASQQGELVFQTLGEIGNHIALLDEKAKQVASGGSLGFYFGLRLSPDGGRVAFWQTDSSTTYTRSDIWLHDFSTGVRSRFTFDTTHGSYGPIWSPDGKRIAFSSNRKGHADLYIKQADGTGDDQLLQESDQNKYMSDWSKDGNILFFLYPGELNKGEISFFNINDRKITTFLSAAFDLQFPRFSPDAKWVVYQTNETSVNQVYVTPFPSAQGKRQVSTDGGAEPIWSNDGKQIFYISGDRVMAVDVTPGGGSLQFSAPKVMPVSQAAPVTGRYDVSSKRHFVVTQVGSESPVLQLMVNWTAVKN